MDDARHTATDISEVMHDLDGVKYGARLGVRITLFLIVVVAVGLELPEVVLFSDWWGRIAKHLPSSLGCYVIFLEVLFLDATQLIHEVSKWSPASKYYLF